MTNARRELLAIPLALVPLLLAWITSWLLYEQAGIGRHRALYDLLRSDESLLAETFAPRAPVETAAREVRWRGRPKRRANVMIVGTSPTRWGLVREAARPLERALGLEVHKLTTNVAPIDGMLDRVRTIHALEPIDVAVVECSLSFLNDYILGFRDEVEAFKGDWNENVPVYDADVLAMETALGLPEKEPGRPAQHRARVRALKPRLDANLWAVGSEGDRDEFVEHPTSVTDDPRVLECHVASYVLGRVADLCRAEGIGLVVYVPPAYRSLLLYAPQGEDGPRLDPAPHARRTLRAAARAGGFKVLDYHDFERDRGRFRDAVHLNSIGAARLSERFFADLERVLASAGADVAYEVVE